MATLRTTPIPLLKAVIDTSDLQDIEGFGKMLEQEFSTLRRDYRKAEASYKEVRQLLNQRRNQLAPSQKATST